MTGSGKNAKIIPLIMAMSKDERKKEPQELEYERYISSGKYKYREVPSDRQGAEARIEGVLSAVLSSGGFSGGQYSLVLEAINRAIAEAEKDGFFQGLSFKEPKLSPISSK